ncbi:MAG: PEP-CTERM sorting domain-containing protein [Algisphaera sp.]
MPTFTAEAGPAWLEYVGYNALLAEKGAALEDGSGVKVMQAEAGSAYAPNAAWFPHKTFTQGSATASNGTSGHASSVGINFYGADWDAAQTMTHGISDVTIYGANDYIGVALGSSFQKSPPAAQGFDVGNHSYVGGWGNTANDLTYYADRMRRFDYVINRDNTVMAVATSTAGLMAASYNAISVGESDGGHGQGLNTKHGEGRYKPDLVAPGGSTSGSTPIVASAAALLREAAAGTNAIQNEVIKANLFAGAAKTFSGIADGVAYSVTDWSHTTTQPLDQRYGFGEVNIYNSYHIFEGGEFAASTTEPVSDIGDQGWDYGNFNGTDDLYYNFTIAPGQAATELSAALVWNDNVIDDDPSIFFNPASSLANLDLELFDSSGNFLDSLIDASLSTAYNTEHIYLTDLAAGDYTFRLSGDMATDYGFSWRMSTTAVPEPASAAVLGLLTLGAFARRRRG